jgi:cell wall-associated NlpC family hydrolase
VSDPRRTKVVEEARAWLGTKYHHMARIKGAGTDCVMLLAEVYESAGVIPHQDIPFYHPDWNLHRNAEVYWDGLLKLAAEIPGPPQPGDVVLFKFGRCFAHGAIVIEWPRIIHAWVNGGVMWGDATQPSLAKRERRFFCPF